MGFLNTATTITVTAKLTYSGRKRLIKESNNIFSHFILGDSDANYFTSAPLTTGQVLANSGNEGENNATNDNIYGEEAETLNKKSGVIIHSKLYKGVATTSFVKPVEPYSNKISDTIVNLGETVVSGSNLTYVTINRNNNTSAFTNLFKSLNLPIILNDIETFTGRTSQQGGWAATAFSGFAAANVLLGIINNNSYGELIDGKSIKCTLPIYTGYTIGGVGTGITTFDIYSTFPKTEQWKKKDLDFQYEDNSTYAEGLFGAGPNVTYLVSDNIQPPNDDASLSWATGYDTFKPFSVNDKQLININTVLPSGLHADQVVGFASLDKGVLVLTHPGIVNNIAIDFAGDPETGTATNDLGLYFYTGGTYNTTIDSILNNLVQNIVCKAGIGEFWKSENETISNGHDNVRISEIGIVAYGNPNDLLAIGKIDRQVIKKKNGFVIFDVRIVI